MKNEFQCSCLEPIRNLPQEGKPDHAEVEAAVRTLIRWSGEDPDREGLIETPARGKNDCGAVAWVSVGARATLVKRPT